jgi:hypothetical protein
LAAWQFWKSSADGIAAFFLWQALSDRMDLKRMGLAAKRRGVGTALGRLRSLARETGDFKPEELEQWARTFP